MIVWFLHKNKKFIRKLALNSVIWFNNFYSNCQVILCINKCGLLINQIREELGRIRKEPEEKTDPQWIKDLKLGKSGMAECLAQKFCEKLNDHYEQSGNNTKYVQIYKIIFNILIVGGAKFG